MSCNKGFAHFPDKVGNATSAQSSQPSVSPNNQLFLPTINTVNSINPIKVQLFNTITVHWLQQEISRAAL